MFEEIAAAMITAAVVGVVAYVTNKLEWKRFKAQDR
jgi:hypothetical protein